MRILQVITGLDKAAGTTTFFENVVAELRGLGHDVVEGVQGQALDSECIGFDVVHIHGLWSPQLHQASQWACARAIPVVWSPHGMLASWAMKHRWWKKLPAWWLYQKSDLLRAAALHATAPNEESDIRRLGLRNRVEVIPLGVNVQMFRPRQKVGVSSRAKVFEYVGRLHPIKGLDLLIEAFSKTGTRHWRLRLAGPDQDGYQAVLEKLATRLGVRDLVDFVGRKSGPDLLDEYARADGLVLASHCENFGSVVVEALASGVPVIATKGTPWQVLEECECGYWVNPSADALSRAMLKVMAMSEEERLEMGRRGRQLVERRYAWQAVGGALDALYKDVVRRNNL